VRRVTESAEEIALPDAFFSHLLPHVEDAGELKAALYVLRALSRKPGVPRFVTYGELSKDETVPHEMLRRALELALEYGVLLRTTIEGEELYFLNAEPDREAMARMESGELDAGKKNIFTLYEQNIGVLTPMIAEELKDAEASYPARWIEDAFREAVSLNKRSWRYIARILERWSQEGRDYGAPGRGSQKIDPDKYIKGKYGHLVRR
jgi:DnaD/phage-associated family protein